jgi:chromosome segregation ATPase
VTPAEVIIGGAVSLLGGGFGSLALKTLDKRLSKRDMQTTQITVTHERETTERHKLSTGERIAEQERNHPVLERLHDECRKEVAYAREQIESLFEINGNTQVELAKVSGELRQCKEQHAEQQRTNTDLSGRLSLIEGERDKARELNAIVRDITHDSARPPK